VFVGAGLLTYLAAAVAGSAGAGSVNPDLVVFAVALSAWMGVGGMTKDLSDVEGDRLAGRRTLPILVGERWARCLIAVSALALAAGFVAAAQLAAARIAPAAWVMAAGACGLAGCVVTGYSHGERSRRRRVYWSFMTTQYAVHLTMMGVYLYF
jgi:4-hydroxybenzoate polyprenyltransferase